MNKKAAAGWTIAAVLAAAVGGAWWWKVHGAEAPTGATAGPGAAAGGAAGTRRFSAANRVQPVSVQKARQQDVRVVVTAIGTITASNTATVRPQVSGVLQAIQFKEGQQVKAGQVLAQIDPRAFQASLGQAEGTLARDKATLDNARIDLARYRDLVAKDAAPKQQLDTQDALVRQLEGTLKSDAASADAARLQLSYTRVLAPIPGRVGLKQADLGNVVSPSDANGLVTITQTRPIALTFAVPSANLPLITAKLHAKQPLKVEAWNRSGTTRLAEGRIETTDNAIDPSTDTIKLKAIFANADDALFPNQAVTVRLQLDTLVDALTVPSAAVLRGAQGFYVYVVNTADNSVSTRVVKPGVVDGDATAVEGALKPGETVVIDGVDRLRDGAKVEVIAADPKQRAGATGGGDRKRGGNRGAMGAASGASAPRTASWPAAADSSAAEARPAWLDRLPPEVADKVMKMSPDERKAWIEKRRAERAAQGGGSN
jgi:multidrug efflux system membrane fusion protein